MASISDVHVGSFISFNNELCQVLEYQHRTPGNLRAFFQVKMRNLKSGKLIENRFRAGESVDLARVDFRMLQYIYSDGDDIVCMDNDTYEQIQVPADLLGDTKKFLKEGMEVKVSFENDIPLSAEAPTFVEMVITYSEPGKKGDTATNTLKPATLENGTVINVPLFVNEGDKIRIDTRTASYCERVK